MANWQPSMVKRVVRLYETSTRPALVVTDVGHGYLKALGNPQGPHALVSEYVGTQLAAWLGLPVCDHAIVHASEGLLEFGTGGRSIGGPAFITRALDGQPWGGLAEELTILSNHETLSGLVLFDMWTRNCDRYRPAPKLRCNVRNVFLAERGQLPGTLEVVALDHTACFRCDADLSPKLFKLEQLRDKTLFGLFPEFKSHILPPSIDKYSSRMQQIQKSDVMDIVGRIPIAWELGEETRSAMIDFIVSRGHYVGQNAKNWLREHCQWQGDLFSHATSSKQV